MRSVHLLEPLVLLIPLAVAGAGELPRSTPESVGLSSERLAELKPALQKLVDQGQIAGGVTLVARQGKVAQVTSFGYRDLASKTPMTEDTIFAIMSMTKPITCVAAMTLVEQGKLGLDDPVDRYLPELKDLRVLGAAKDDTETEIATIPAKRSITIRDLLSHTSGIAYGGLLASDARLARSYAQAGVQGPGLTTIASMVKRLATVPLKHQPGEDWTYGLSHDVLGRVIEVVSGQSLDRFLQERIFSPLDMPDTSFFVPEAKRDRAATAYRAGIDQALTPLPRSWGSETYFSGGGGLASTARDYARFAQMLLEGGALDGVRILKSETIAMMTANQIGDITPRLGPLAVGKYGLGFGLISTPGPDGGKPVLDRYYWGGLLSTNFWIDPRHELVAVIMTQVMPTNHGNAVGVFRAVVEKSIEK